MIKLNSPSESRGFRLMTLKYKIHLKLTASFIALIMVWFSSIQAATFDEQYAKIKGDVSGTSDSDINNLILKSIEAKEIEKAIVLLRDWMDVNTPKNPIMLYNAGRASMLIEDFEQAKSFYKAFLDKSDLKSSEAKKAAEDFAYIIFIVERDSRGMVYYQKLVDFPKYHKVKSLWKYDQTYWNALTYYNNRAGLGAEMNFLATLLEEGVPSEQLRSKYASMFASLANSYYDSFNLVRQKGKFEKLQQASKELAEACAVDPELKALFDWKNAIYSYYLIRDKDKNAKPPIKELKALLDINPDYVATVVDDAIGGFNWGYQRGVDQTPKHEMEKVIADAMKKASPLIQLNYQRYLDSKKYKLPFGDDKAAKDKTFMASLKKPDLKKTIALIGNSDPNKISYLRYALEKQSWKTKNDENKIEKWNNLEMTSSREMDQRGRKGKHPLAAALKARIEKDIKSGKLNPYIIMAWLNTMPARGRYGHQSWGNTPEEDLAFMVKIDQSKAYDKLTLTQKAMLAHRIEDAVKLDAKEKLTPKLRTLTKDSSASDVASALKEAIANYKKSEYLQGISGVKQIASLTKETVIDDSVYPLMIEYLRMFADSYLDRDMFRVVNNLLDVILEKKDYDQFYGSARLFWTIPNYHDSRQYMPVLLAFVKKQSKENPALAALMTRSALQLMKYNNSSKSYRSIRPMRGEFQNMLAKALEDMGVVTIPVPKNDPAYPLFLSQQQLTMGNEASAYQLFKDNKETLLSAYKQLRVSYLLWVIEQLTKVADTEVELIELRNELVEKCDEWIKDNGPFTLSNKIMFEILKGDIAFIQKQSAKAKTIYTQIIKNKAYDESLNQNLAYLRLADLERKVKSYDDALATIKLLIMKNVPEYINRALYVKAETLFDMGNYEEANNIAKSIISRDPTFNDASLLQGRIMVKEQNFRPGYEVPIGALNAKKWITTGEKLTITLNDPNLTSSQGGTIIEVDVWSESGDRETVVLSQSGDAKNIFTGMILIKLGKPNKGDSILQVIGDDKVYYAYNKNFAKRMKIDDLGINGPIRIKSDAELFASAKEMLSVEEQKAEDARILKEMASGDNKKFGRMHNFDKTELVREQYADKIEEAVEKAKKRLAPPLKPGNPLHIRVIDDDRSRTDGIDELAVTVRTSSGDSVNRVILKETGNYTGVFDGTVATSGAQPRAFCEKEATGNNANSVISPKKSAIWKSKNFEDKRPIEFVIDLNDNIELGEMTITNNDSASTFQLVELQTGMSRDDMTTVGILPETSKILKPYLPSVEIFRQPNPNHTTAIDGKNVRALKSYMATGYARSRCPYNKKDIELSSSGLKPKRIAKNINNPSEAFSALTIPKEWNRKRANYAFIVSSIKASFFEKEDVTREFQLKLGELTVKEDPKKKNKKSKKKKESDTIHGISLLIDGKVIAQGTGEDMKGSITLEPGLHTIEILSSGMSSALHGGRKATLYANLGPKGKMQICPHSMFNPLLIPKYAKPHKNNPVEYFQKDGSNLKVKFARDSRARIIKLKFYGKEGTHVSLNKINLTTPNGKKILPVKTDYQELAKNQTLETLIGDKVTVIYKDDRFVGQKDALARKPYEKFIDVSFSNASASFSKIFPKNIGRKRDDDDNTFRGFGYGTRHDTYKRFAYGMDLPIMVIDSDMNTSKNIDKIDVSLVVNGNNKKIKIKASEMPEYPGVFTAVVTPVDSLEAEKQRRQARAKETGEPVKPVVNPLVVPKGGSITLTYRDQENVKPGIPVDRIAGVDHAVYKKPIMEVASISTKRLPEDEKMGMRGLTLDFTPPGYEYLKRHGDEAHNQRMRERMNEYLKNMKMSESDEIQIRHLIKPRAIASKKWYDIDSPPPGGFNFYQGLFTEVKVVAPHLVLKKDTTIDVYMQAESTRQKYKAGMLEEVKSEDGFDFDDESGDNDEERYGKRKKEKNKLEPLEYIKQSEASKAIFDINMPGTVRIKTQNNYPPNSYGFGKGQKHLSAYLNDISLSVGSEMGDGYFWNRRIVRSGEFNQKAFDEARRQGRIQPILVKPNDIVHIGFRYWDENGKEQWMLAKASVKADGFLDVMDQEYREQAKKLFLGERAYVRVVDMGRDESPDIDSCYVHLSAKSGAQTVMKLYETAPNSGIFNNSFFLTYAKNEAEAKAMLEDPANQKDGHYDASRKGFPVIYGDTVRIRYKDSGDKMVPFREISIAEGADGFVEPFTKKYGNSEIAMMTQFAMAESYLELAKRHRKMAKDAKKDRRNSDAEKFKSVAEIEYKRAKDLLELAINTFREQEAVAHATYLLGNLLFEEADAISRKEKEKREERFQAALSRYVKVTSSYAKTSFASKAQFKKAMTYEKLGEADIAAAEYVKLAYKFPDSEYLGVAMARLGFHFLRGAMKQEKEFNSFIKTNNLEDVMISKKPDENTDPAKFLDAKDMQKSIYKEYLKAGKILRRVVERFPSHELATKCGLTAGHCYRKGNQPDKSVQIYKKVYKNQSYDSDSRAQAMYWVGKIFLNQRNMMGAYSTLMQITVDFPETKWAANARAELAKPRMVDLDTKLQIKRAEGAD